MEAHSENIKRARISGCFTSCVTDDFLRQIKTKRARFDVFYVISATLAKQTCNPDIPQVYQYLIIMHS